jgi:MoaA/NifB/PqqE/SkfB family radical SAM enzyme
MNKFILKTRETLILTILDLLINAKAGRKILFNKLQDEIRKIFLDKKATGISSVKYVQEVKVQYLIALLGIISKNIEKDYYSKKYIRNLTRTMLKGLLYKDKSGSVKNKFEQNYGYYPPSFCTVSPTQKCNLRCSGCYALSDRDTKSSLPYWVVERLVREMHDLVGSRFIVISGGEPFLWKNSEKGIIDLAESFPDMFFMAYTNGTLLDDKTIDRLLTSGNLIPAISVEGYARETDERRGRGIYKKLLLNMEKLKRAGLPFGVSVTATKKNIDILLDDTFYEYWFEDVGATFMWMFHLMPIGRAHDTMELMISAEDRKKLFEKWEHLLFDRQFFVADFWNSGAASDGCMAYAKNGGYFYVDWNGNITPCVFVPYYKDNIYDLYKDNKTIVDAITSDYFTRGRNWQREYNGFNPKPKNILAPCSIRDHHRIFRESILTEDVKPLDENAEIALKDPEYVHCLDDFDEQLAKITDPMWEERLNKKS